MASDVYVYANRHQLYLIVSFMWRRSGRPSFMHAPRTWKPVPSTCFGQWLSGHARERTAQQAYPCRLTDAVQTGPCPCQCRGCYWPTSLQRIRPAYAWAGRGRIQRTVSLDATRARAPAACPLLGSQQLVETPRILTPPCSAGLRHVLPGYQPIVSASSRL
jgi:hypothetical protein